MANKPSFPDTPRYLAKWAAIYMEPILNSGERITIGIAAVGMDGAISVRPTLNLEQLKCVYGKGGIELLNSATFCLGLIEAHLRTTNLFDWKPTVSGILVGEVREAAGNELSSIIANAMRLTASFSHGAHELTESNQLMVVAPTITREDNWINIVKQNVRNTKPDYYRYFNTEMHLERGLPTVFDYVGARYAANLTEIPSGNANKLKNSLNSSRVKLWTLARLKDLWHTTQNCELIIKHPPLRASLSASAVDEISDVIYQLREESNAEGLSIFDVVSAEQASSRILEKELPTG